ncbi:MAG: glycosyltransferase [Bacteroidota bacterium]
MKILFVSPAYPLRGGVAHYNAQLTAELAGTHQVETITFKRQYPRLLFPGKTQQEAPGEHPAPGAPRLVDSMNPFNWLAVGAEIRRRRPDLLVFNYWLPLLAPCFGTIARCARKDPRLRVLLICDNIIPHEHRPLDGALTRYMFRPADCFIVQSDTVERELAAFWPGALYRKAPLPVPTLFGASAPGKREARARLGITARRVVLFFGFIRPYKGLMTLLEAMGKAARSLDVHLVVAGEFYEDPAPYRERVRELGLESRVTFLSDYIPRERVGTVFAASDVVALPYLSASQSGIAQLAYNFERPVIASDTGGLGEIVVEGRTGFLVPPGDAEALAGRITDYFREGKEEEFTCGVRAEKPKYTWANVARAMEELAALTGAGRERGRAA